MRWSYHSGRADCQPRSSGKTTLLDLLADRISSGKVEGEIRVNGRPRGSTFKHYAAYVQQGTQPCPRSLA